MGLKPHKWQNSLALLSWASTDLQNSMDYERWLLCSSDNWSCKADTLKIAWAGLEGHRKVPKVVQFGDLRGLVLGAILQNFISLSIQRVRSSFFVQIEAEVKGISHKKLISKRDFFEWMLLVSKSRVKYQNPYTLALISSHRCHGQDDVQFLRSWWDQTSAMW